MKLYAFSDFHLSGDPPTKPMDIFGDHWKNHRQKIINSWLDTITENDTVVLAGDLSWAMNLKTAISDLLMIGDLPGRKIIVRGNHDYWWDTVTKMTKMTQGKFEFIHNCAIKVGQIALTGTRGWIAETSKKFTKDDEKILAREEGRMERGLIQAQKLPCERIIACLHYPPYDDVRNPTRMHDIMKKYGATDCIYGHIHGNPHFYNIPSEVDGIKLHLTSVDYLDFKPLFICDLEEDNA